MTLSHFSKKVKVAFDSKHLTCKYALSDQFVWKLFKNVYHMNSGHMEIYQKM